MKAGASMRGVLNLGCGATAIFLVATLAGCSSVGNMLGSSSTSTPAPAESGSTAPQSSSETVAPKDSLTNMILGKPAAGPGPADNAFQQDEMTCPEVTVRPGTSTLQIGSKGAGEVSAMDLRYQGSLIRFSRECKYTPALVTMKLGIEGRIIVGPAGGPGQIEVPVRFAIVQEGPAPKTVLSKLVRIPVTIGNEPTVDFTHIDPDVAFPMPRPQSALDRYVVYVGFDPTALAPQKPAPRRKR
jgi:hypothetical protein